VIVCLKHLKSRANGALRAFANPINSWTFGGDGGIRTLGTVSRTTL
jgi:hypothetical protein